MDEHNNKEKLLKGAEELFMKYGVRSISMDDIARHLSVSKKTLYHHFEDKDDLVCMVCKGHMQKEKKQFDTLRDGAVNAIDELARLSVYMRKDIENINPSLLFDLQKYHPKAWQVWLDFKHKVIRESMIRNLKQGIEEGYYRAEINPDVLATLRIESMQLAFDEQIFPHRNFSLADVQVQLFDHFVHGLVTEKGRKLYQRYKEKINLETTNLHI